MKRFRETSKDTKTRHDVAEWAMKKFIDEIKDVEDFWTKNLPFYSIFEEFSASRSMRISRYILSKHWKLKRGTRRI